MAKKTCQQLLEIRLDVLMKAATLLPSENVEAIHDTRVASRRLRSVLKAHKNLFNPDTYVVCADAARSITRALGMPRELDVTMAILNKHSAACPKTMQPALDQALQILQTERNAYSPEIARCAKTLTAGSFAAAFSQLIEQMQPGADCYIDHAQAAVTKHMATLNARYALWLENGADQTLHRVRIACKKCRYVCELYAPLFAPAFQQFIKGLHAVQDHLGTWNDLRVLRDHLERLEPDTSGTTNALSSYVTDLVVQAADHATTACDEFFTRDDLPALLTPPSDVMHTCCKQAALP